MVKRLARKPRGFKDIPGYEGLYAISRNGRVLGYPNTIYKDFHVLRNTDSGNGYKVVRLVDVHGKRGNAYIHRLLAKVYLHNPDPKTHTEVNHLNGDKKDYRLKNLEWCTPSHNMKHAFATGLNYVSEKRKAILRARWPALRDASCVVRRKKIVQLSKDGHYIRTFNSTAEAEATLNISNQAICHTLKGRRRSAGGFKWAYAPKEN